LKTVGDKAAQAESTAVTASTKSSDAVIASGNALAVAHEARQEADSFEKDIVSAKQQASAAESHLADALREATNAENELRKVQGRLADRVFTAEQRGKFAGALTGKTKFPIRLESPDGEPLRYARQIASAFPTGWDIDFDGLGITTLSVRDAQIEALIQANSLLGAPMILFGPNSNRANVSALSAAFTAAGVEIVMMEMTKQTTNDIAVYIPLKAP
jgi:hypothetical protein